MTRSQENSGYWFRDDDDIPALVRPVSSVYECGDREIIATAIDLACRDDDEVVSA